MARKPRNPLSEATNRAPQTRMVHGGTVRSQHGETSEALFVTSGFVYASSADAEARFKGEAEGHIYSRFSNPTVEMFQRRMATLEGAEAARATATGMAAVTTSLMSLVRAGDHVVSAKALFGSCRYVVEDFLPRWGVETTLVDGRDPGNFAVAMRPNTKAVFLESPTNPTQQLVDIRAVAEIAHAHGALVVVDNVFATPVLQHPLKLGADLVVYSATKHIDGQGRVLGGVILGPEELISGDIHTFIRQTGPSMSPFNAWVLLKGLETLELRVHQMTRSAGEISNFLSESRKIRRVHYPDHPSHPQHNLARSQMEGGSTMVAFEVSGGQREAFAAADALAIIKISNNLGDAKSIVTHPWTTTHQRLPEEERLELGITPSLLRLSVGLEATEDLIADLEFALSVI